jgi:hypothetical protein
LYLDSLSFIVKPGLTYVMDGVYSCLVRGSGAEPQWTKEVVVSVLGPAKITRQPEDQRVVLGKDLLLEVEAHIIGDKNEDNPFYQPSVQWYRGSNPVVDNYSVDGHFSGAKSTVLSIRNVTANELGDDYHVVLRGTCDSLYSNMVSIKEYPKVFINQNPDNLSVCEGSQADFKVTASASDQSATVEYQWRKDGIAIPKATTDMYSIPAVAAGDVGNYDCVVTVLPGGMTETTTAATLGMKLAPTISKQPAVQNAIVGNPFFLFITASGEEPITYQWYKDDVIIDNATSSSFSVSSATLSDAGSYKCEVKNECGEIYSDAVAVSVSTSDATGVNDLTNGGFALTNNTPNPFNETTTIKYFVPVSAPVRLAITDVYGKEIAVVVNSTVNYGWNEIKVSASDFRLSSGVYYYTLSSGNFSITRKMVVVK